MPHTRPATSSDHDAAIAVLVSAFAGDPLMAYFFPGDPLARDAAVRRFFSLLLRARLALAMPALVLDDAGSPWGVAMGYDSSRPDWPAALQAEWQALERDLPGFAERLAAYDAISTRFAPSAPHAYLGVLGVEPARQGQGGGRALLDAFCARTANDPQSSGVYLETATPANLAFYGRAGFRVSGDAPLDDSTHLWCLFRPT